MNSADRNSITPYRFVMKAHANLAAVLALSQNGTQGAVTALGTAREKGKVKLATFDASPFQMTGLATGTIQLTVTQEPGVEEADAVDQAVNAIAGKKVVPYLSAPMVAITPKNMNDPASGPTSTTGPVPRRCVAASSHRTTERGHGRPHEHRDAPPGRRYRRTRALRGCALTVPAGRVARGTTASTGCGWRVPVPPKRACGQPASVSGRRPA
jgi:hypothetical protein